SIGVDYILDSALGTDLSLLASAQEFVDRYNNGNCNEGATPSPLLASWCPGWVCYAEKTHPEVIPHLSRVKSPQQMMGSVVKDYLARSLGKSPDTIYHTTVMPCYDKKLEASRDDFFSDIYRTRDVDCVITTGEMERLLKSYGRSIADFEKEEEGSISLDRTFKATPNAYSLSRGAGTSAGGYLEYILSFAARALFNISITPDQVAVPGGSPLVKHVNVRNRVDCREVTLCNPNTGEPLLRFAAFYGFRHLQNLVRKFKTGRCDYHYVEIAACPGACSNGGGQLRSENANPKALKDWAAHVEHLYRSVGPTQLPEENHTMNAILSDWLPQGLQSEHAKRLLLTNFRAVADSSQGGGGSNSSAVMVNW
ncbi:Cytosolic Fe-S cluster assembly factor nar1, partial [Spiromyces aspiralis]